MYQDYSPSFASLLMVKPQSQANIFYPISVFWKTVRYFGCSEFHPHITPKNKIPFVLKAGWSSIM